MGASSSNIFKEFQLMEPSYSEPANSKNRGIVCQFDKTRWKLEIICALKEIVFTEVFVTF